MQADVGSGDAVTPAPELIDYPSLLDLPRPRLRVYRPETTITEKLHAIAILGMANTRMRDFFDIYELARQHEFDGVALASAIRNTFARRRTPLGPDLPPVLTPAFGADSDKQAQWRAFLRKSRLVDAPQELLTATEAIAGFVGPILVALHVGWSFDGRWPAGGAWHLSHLDHEADRGLNSSAHGDVSRPPFGHSACPRDGVVKFVWTKDTRQKVGVSRTKLWRMVQAGDRSLMRGISGV